MKLNRSSLRRMILAELRQLNEAAGGYDTLSAEDKLYAQVGFIDRAIQKQPLEKRASLADKFLSDCRSIKAAIDAGKAAEWQPGGTKKKGSKPVFDGAVTQLQKKQTSEISGMVARGKTIIKGTR